MKKKIVSSLLILSLGIAAGAGASTLTLEEKADDLKLQFGQSTENFYHDIDSELQPFKESEMSRLDKETHEYMTQKLVNKKEEMKAEITKQTDAKIAEVNNYIDHLLSN